MQRRLPGRPLGATAPTRDRNPGRRCSRCAHKTSTRSRGPDGQEVALKFGAWTWRDFINRDSMSAPETFEQAERDLQSDDQLTREQAMHCLLFWTGKNQRIHASALPLFQRILSTAKDARMLTHAARGLE